MSVRIVNGEKVRTDNVCPPVPKPIAAAIASLALAGCAGTTTYEIAVGANVSRAMPWSDGRDGGFDGPRDTVRFTVRRDGQRFFCGASHISHLSAGWPVNNAREDWLDVVECGVRFKSNH